MRRADFLLGVAWCIALWHGSAGASGFSVAHFASEHGHPTTDNATAVYFNPAALSLSDGAHAFADLSVAARRVTYERTGSATDAPDPPDARGANVGRASLVNPLVNPVLAGTYALGQFSIGAGFFTPFGGSVSWNQRGAFDGSRYPGIVDGVQRFQSIEGDIVTSQFTVAGAYRVARTGLSLGLSASVMRSWVDDVRAWSNGGNDVTTEGRSLLSASGYAAGFGFGLLYEVMPDRLWLGLSYQSRPNVSGGMRLHGSLQNDIGGPSSANIDMIYDLPDVIRWGIRYRPGRAGPKLELRLFGDITSWSAFENQCVVKRGEPCNLGPNGSEPMGGQILQNVPRDFKDSFGVRAGVSIWPTRPLEFFSGLGFESNAVPDRTFEPGLPDWNGVSFALGGRYAFTPRIHAALSLTYFAYIPRDVHSGLAQFSSPSQSPDASGHYTQQVGVANTNVDFAF